MADYQESGAFDIPAMTADLAAVRTLIRNFYGQVQTEDWRRPTEDRPKGWTLKEAFCHIAAIAETLEAALESVLEGNPAYISPIRKRTKLAEFNREQIDKRMSLPPEHLLQSFLEALNRTEVRIADLSAAELAKPIQLNAYNRPLSVAEVVGNQLSHPVIVHGAQLANGIGAEPLWRQFSADLMRRQITRFLHIFSCSYWPERGGDLSAIINFNIRGEGGGRWHIKISKDGGSAGEGYIERPSITMHFPNPDAFCSVFTVQVTPMKALLSGRIFAWGKNMPLAFKFSKLFTPT